MFSLLPHQVTEVTIPHVNISSIKRVLVQHDNIIVKQSHKLCQTHGLARLVGYVVEYHFNVLQCRYG